jgi:hypothetical protein
MRHRSVVVGAWLMVGALAGATETIAAGIANTPSSTWVTDGTVLDAAVSGDLVYLAGTFTRIGPRTGPVVFLDPVTGDPLPGGALVTGGLVTAMEPDGQGGYVIAGDFTRVNGMPRRGLARLTSTGALDPAFAPAIVDRVQSLAVRGSIVYVGGYVGVPATSTPLLAAVDLDSGAPTAFHPSVPFAPGAIFVLPNGHVVAGVRSLTASYGVEFDELTGARLAEWPTVPWVAVDATTVVSVVGYTIQRFDTRTRAATDIAVTAPDPRCLLTLACRGIIGMALRQQTLYITGDFVTVAGTARAGAAAVDVTSGALAAWQPPATTDRQPWRVFAGPSRVLVEYAGTVVATDPATGADLGWTAYLLGGPATRVIDDGTRVVAAGDFAGAGGVPRRSLAQVRWPDGAPTAWTLQGALPPFTYPSRLALAGSRLFVGFQGVLSSTLREVDGVSGQLQPYAATFDGESRALRVLGDRLLVGGDFTTVDGVARSGVASFDLSSAVPRLDAWAPALSSPDRFGVVNSLAAAPGVVILTGNFTAVAGQARSGLAAVDATTGAPLPWAPRPTPEPGGGALYFVEIAGSRVYVSGYLTAMDGEPRRGIAAFDVTGRLTAWAPDQPVYPYRLNGYEQHAWYYDGHLYVGRGYAVDAEDGALTLWQPDLDTNLLGGAWAPAPGYGLVLHAMVRGGFALYPRVDPPGAVTHLAASVAGNAVSFAWQGTPDAATYVLEAGRTSGGADLVRLDLRSTATHLSTAGPDGRYFVRVRAKALGGLGPPSNERVIVLGPGACDAAPLPPTGLSADTSGPHVRFTWLPPPGTVDATTLEVSFDGGLAFVPLVRLPGAAASFDGTGPPGQYVVRLRAENGCGASDASVPVAVSLTAVATPPPAPAGLTAVVGPAATVTLAWTPPTGLPTGYAVEAGTAPGLSNLGRVSVPRPLLVATGVPPGTYFVRVRAENAAGTSPPSAEIRVVVP